MKGLQRSSPFVLTLALSLVLAPVASAETPDGSGGARPSIVDLSLSGDSLLQGQLVDASGNAVDNAQISVWQRDQRLGAIMTGREGRFQIQGLQAGLYRLDCPGNSLMCRVWPTDIAPPTAKETVVLVTGDSVVRGQYGCFDPVTTTSLLLGIAGVTLAAITLAKVNDIEDDVKNLQSP